MSTRVTHAPSLEGQTRIAVALEHQNQLLAAIANGSASAEFVDATFAALLDDTNTTEIFKIWWPLSETEGQTKTDRLNRWFTMLRNDKTYGVEFHAPEVSGDTFGAYTDASAGLTCELSTDTVQGADTLDEHRAFWWMRVNAIEIDEQGTLDVLYHEFEPGFDPTGEVAPVYTVQIAPYIQRYKTDTKLVCKLRTMPQIGFHSWVEGRNPDGTQRAFVAHAAYGAGLDTNGYYTSGAGKRPLIRTSYNAALSAVKKGRQYQTIWQTHDQAWLLLMWQLRHASLAPSGQMEGCLSYNYQYLAALGEENTRRVLLTPAQAANIIVGCAVEVGETGMQTDTDRSAAHNYDLADCVQVAGKESITIDGTEYVAVVLDIPATITTTTTTRISTMPWWSGSTDSVLGRGDGSRGSNTNGRYPCRCAGIEFLQGCYRIAAGEQYQYAEGPDGSSELQQYACTVQGSEASSITSAYVDTGLRLYATEAGWLYIAEMDDTYDGALFPKAAGTGSGSSYLRDAFYHYGRSSGLSVPWLAGRLSGGGSGGLVCVYGCHGSGYADWDGAPGLSRRCWRGELTEN